jgi:hypothetical protein
MTSSRAKPSSVRPGELARMLVPSGMEDAEFGDFIFESSQLQSPLTELLTLLNRAQLSLSLGHAYFQVLHGVVKCAVSGHLGL